ncbi:MAG: DUF354 domain-containing protein [Aigarchaeota archaeon]|nr:DUF354 domain-containing protein [Aigarchaeota archaeon]MDW8092550.1 DUF354 domain-containing protein [Nitrososphaerota archaeon]
MKVWIDVLTPKQALFYWALSKVLQKRSIEVITTSRDYEQVNWMWSHLGIKPLVFGEYGGSTLYGKLLASSERQLRLVKLIGEEDVSVGISSGSIEACRICYGLKVPHVLSSDTPHSPINRMCVPLSESITSPYVIPKESWTRYGISPSRIFTYRALDPYAWLIRYRDLIDVNLPKPLQDGYALVRVPESTASYLTGKGLEETVALVKSLIEFWDGKVLVMTRFSSESLELRKSLRDPSIKFLSKPVLALPLIKNAEVVICGGGTIAQEAALLGRPTVLFYPGEVPEVHKFLLRKGLIDYVGPGQLRELRDVIERLTSAPVKRTLRERARSLISSMEDPALLIYKVIERVVNGGQ